MVGNLTVGKKKYADVEDQVRETLDQLEVSRGRLIELIDLDAAVFAPLAASYGMPRETSDQQRLRNQAMQDALADCCRIPLAIMEECAQVIQMCDFMAHHGSRLAVSDAGVSAVFAKAALQGASLNIFINAASMDDKKLAGIYRDRADGLIADFGARADALYAYVLEEVR
jgi:formiminotetrahydrofolate cyclodeaminase